MPRPVPRRGAIVGGLVALGCAALGPAALHEALAAAAGTLFEAAPFVLVAELLPQRFGFLAQVAGCGCRGRLPGALSLPATALCWIAFGPWITLGRLALSLASLRISDRLHVARTGAPPAPDALSDLVVLAACAALATLAVRVLFAAPAAAAQPLGGLMALGCGLGLGLAAPCALAAVAIAAALAPHLLPAAAGILLTGGTIAWPRTPLLRLRAPGKGHATDRLRPDGGCRSARRRSILVRVALAGALFALVQMRVPGFVNPRLLPVIALGAPLALVSAGRIALTRSAGRDVSAGGSKPGDGRAALIPAIMLLAVATGSPLPSAVADATQLADAYPGERLSFLGILHRLGGASVLERFEITCCRADASPVTVRLARPIGAAEGSWVAATGILVPSSYGLELRPDRWHVTTPPSDPFVYR